MPTTPEHLLKIEDRRHMVVELKRIGMTDRAIQTHMNSLGIRISHVTVNKDWHKVLNDASASRNDDVNEMKELQLRRYEAVIESHWAKATGHKLSQPDTNNDPDPRSAEIVLRTIKGIRELFGLDNAVGTAQNPLTLNLPPELEVENIELDLEGLSHDELERLHDIFGAVIEAQRIATGDA